jgi:hypothetical protein
MSKKINNFGKKNNVYLLALTSLLLFSCNLLAKSSPLYKKDGELKFFHNPLISSDDLSPAIINELKDKKNVFQENAFLFSQLFYYLNDLTYKVYSVHERYNDIPDSENYLHNIEGSFLLTQTRIYELNLNKEPFNGGLYYLFETQSNFNDFGDSYRYYYDYHMVEYKDNNYYDVFPTDGYFCEVTNKEEYKTDCSEVDFEFYSVPHLISMIQYYNHRIFPIYESEDSFIEFFYGQFGTNSFTTDLRWKDYIKILSVESFLTSEIVLTGAFRNAEKNYFNSLRLFIRFIFSYLNNGLLNNLFTGFPYPAGVHYEDEKIIFYNKDGGRYCYPSMSECNEIRYYGTPDLIIDFENKNYFFGDLDANEEMTRFSDINNYVFSTTELEELFDATNELEFIDIIETIKDHSGKTDIEIFKSLMLL